MGLFKVIIEIDNVKKDFYPTTFGALALYPVGTKRTIKRLTFKGWKIYKQVASIESDANLDSYYYYNTWKNVD